MNPKTFLCDWSKIDWSKSSRQIAKEQNCSIMAVSIWRKRLAPETIKPPVDVANVDWSLSNREIARMHNCHHGTISRLRQIHAPETERKMKRKARTTQRWRRIDQKSLDQFDEKTRRCSMNCGQHADDPRSRKEIIYQCNDCEIRPNEERKL